MSSSSFSPTHTPTTLRRALSLPPIPTTSPFSSPFLPSSSSPLTHYYHDPLPPPSDKRRSSRIRTPSIKSYCSPELGLVDSPEGEGEGRVVRAWMARRAGADLLRALDLAPVVSDHQDDCMMEAKPHMGGTRGPGAEVIKGTPLSVFPMSPLSTLPARRISDRDMAENTPLPSTDRITSPSLQHTTRPLNLSPRGPPRHSTSPSAPTSAGPSPSAIAGPAAHPSLRPGPFRPIDKEKYALASTNHHPSALKRFPPPAPPPAADRSFLRVSRTASSVWTDNSLPSTQSVLYNPPPERLPTLHESPPHPTQAAGGGSFLKMVSDDGQASDKPPRVVSGLTTVSGVTAVSGMEGGFLALSTLGTDEADPVRVLGTASTAQLLPAAEVRTKVDVFNGPFSPATGRYQEGMEVMDDRLGRYDDGLGSFASGGTSRGNHAKTTKRPSQGTILRGPPSLGTPLGEGVEEERASLMGSAGGRSTDEEELGEKRKEERARKGKSKVEQVLGTGAEMARIEGEALREAIQEKGKGAHPSLQASSSGHKPSRSDPTGLERLPRPSTPPPTHPPIDPLSPLSLRHLHSSPSSPHGRAASVDSLPSSLRSTHTLSRLLPPPATSAPAKPLPALPLHKPKDAASRVPRDLSARNALTPDQRAVLLRRTRKLERMLGESLGESDIERLVIEPSTGGQTVVTQVSEDAWPDDHSLLGRAKVPEYDREDCLPQTERKVHEVQPAALSRSQSALRKAKVKLGLGLGGQEGGGAEEGKSGEHKGGLQVYVAREKRVAEARIPDGVPQAGLNRSGEVTPVTGASEGFSSPSSSKASGESKWFDEGEGEIRRLRRHQLAKLHRLLGVPVPSSALGRSTPIPPSTPPPPNAPLTDLDHNHWAPRPATLTWTERIRNKTTGLRAAKPDVDESFLELGERSSLDRYERKSDRLGRPAGPGSAASERWEVRKRGKKLEHVFGEAPPAKYLSQMYPHFQRVEPIARPGLSTSSSAVTPTSTATAPPTESFESYERSLQSLLHLATHDRALLASIVDSLDESASAPSPSQSASPSPSSGGRGSTTSPRAVQTPSPPSPLLDSPYSPSYDPLDAATSPADPHSHAARRDRTKKLSQFFGEPPLDFEHPPTARVATGGNQGVGHASKGTRQRRRETLESVIAEMWRGVQGEVSGGRMRVDQAGRLGEMLGALRGRREGERAWEEI